MTELPEWLAALPRIFCPNVFSFYSSISSTSISCRSSFDLCFLLCILRLNSFLVVKSHWSHLNWKDDERSILLGGDTLWSFLTWRSRKNLETKHLRSFFYCFHGYDEPGLEWLVAKWANLLLREMNPVPVLAQLTLKGAFIQLLFLYWANDFWPTFTSLYIKTTRILAFRW